MKGKLLKSLVAFLVVLAVNIAVLEFFNGVALQESARVALGLVAFDLGSSFALAFYLVHVMTSR